MLKHEKKKARAEKTSKQDQAEENILKTIRIETYAIARAEAHAVARRWFVILFLISCIVAVSSIFVLYLHSTQSRLPAALPSSISESSAKYLQDRVDDLAESQKWVLLIFGGLAALITLLGASFQLLQYTEVRREREAKEPSQLIGLRQVNEVIETVGKTLAFRLREEEELQEAQKTLKNLESTINVLRTEADEAFKLLKQQLPTLIAWPRISFTSLDPIQEAFTKTFLQRFSMLPNWFRKASKNEQDDLAMGQITYFAGVIAFVNNDIIFAMNLLEEAKECRDRNSSSKDAQIQFWGAFVTYWMGLIEKNWGKLEKAKNHIKDSLLLYGPYGKIVKKNEWLTRLLLAEILIYDKVERPTAQNTIQEILNEIGVITKQTRSETKKMWGRAKLLSANGEMADENFEKAMAIYEEVLQNFPENYYAEFSLALCLRKLGVPVNEVNEKFAQTFKKIQDSGDLKSKKELGPLVGLYYVAMLAAQWSGKRDFVDEYKRQLYELLDPQKTSFNSYQLRIFIPDKLRFISAEDLRGMLNEI